MDVWYVLYSLCEYPHALYIFLSIVVGIKWEERIPTLGFHIDEKFPTHRCSRVVTQKKSFWEKIFSLYDDFHHIVFSFSIFLVHGSLPHGSTVSVKELKFYLIQGNGLVVYNFRGIYTYIHTYICVCVCVFDGLKINILIKKMFKVLKI